MSNIGFTSNNLPPVPSVQLKLIYHFQMLYLCLQKTIKGKLAKQTIDIFLSYLMILGMTDLN